MFLLYLFLLTLGNVCGNPTTAMASTPESLPHKHRLNVGEYCRMAETGILAPDARVELINGEIIDMAPLGSKHAACVKRLGKLLNLRLDGTAIVSVQDPLRLSEFSEPEPDVALLKLRDDFYASAHPGPQDTLLVIEVADSSLEYDRDVKLPLYAAHGIPEVWLVDLEGKHLSTYREPSGNKYRQIETPASLDALTPRLLPRLALDLSDLF